MVNDLQLEVGLPHAAGDYLSQSRDLNAARAQEVRMRLAVHQGAEAARVEVAVRGDTAILSGAVDHAPARGRAAELALKVEGVRAVLNRLVVQP